MVRVTYLFFVFVLSLSSSAHAAIRFLLISDWHAQTPTIPHFVRTLSSLVQGQNSSPIVILANGDIGGSSAWSDHDEGMSTFGALADLGRHHIVIPVLGNHDGLDLTAPDRDTHLFF